MMTDEDKSLFLTAMTAVSPLKSNKKIIADDTAAKQAKIISTLRKIKHKQNQTEIRLPETLKEELSNSSIANVSSFEAMLYHKKGIRLQELSKLKKGEFNNQGELDLHGQTADQAREAIHHFIAEAYFRKLRYVRIIHGKGYNSNEQFPILKNIVNQELRTIKVILAFCSAPPKEGGVGAVNIFLKAQ